MMRLLRESLLCLHTSGCCAFSTSGTMRQRLQSTPLPPAKLRALITLYHPSSTFITPANLSQRIDLAFTDPLHLSQTASNQCWNYGALQR
ncbi:hypothetical protein K439DRAFT_1552471 [Ramaria rubella]|nr:hypothetical protein K439DRAFT_1552471 [Ramaria rubella]